MLIFSESPARDQNSTLNIKHKYQNTIKLYVHIACVHAWDPAGQSPKYLPHSQALFGLSFSYPLGFACTRTDTHVRISHTNADIPAQSVVNRSLPAFHFCSKSIGLCRTQHLIEARKVTDYWIVTYCIEGCLQLHCGCVPTLARLWLFLLLSRSEPWLLLRKKIL